MNRISIAMIATFMIAGPAIAENVIVNSYQVQQEPSGWVCWGLVGCLIAGALDAQEHQAQAPHTCSVWNGRQYVKGTCLP